MDGRARWAVVQGVAKESDTTEGLSAPTHRWDHREHRCWCEWSTEHGSRYIVKPAERGWLEWLCNQLRVKSRWGPAGTCLIRPAPLGTHLPRFSLQPLQSREGLLVVFPSPWEICPPLGLLHLLLLLRAGTFPPLPTGHSSPTPFLPSSAPWSEGGFPVTQKWQPGSQQPPLPLSSCSFPYHVSGY